MSDLLPCPFCGNDDIQDRGESTWSRPVKWMYCTECQAHGPHVMLGRGEPEGHWHYRIREEWNRRAIPATDAREAALREAAAVADAFADKSIGDADLWLKDGMPKTAAIAREHAQAARTVAATIRALIREARDD